MESFDEIATRNNTVKVLHVQSTNEQDIVSIDLSSFNSGIYQIKLSDEKSTVIRKAIKN